MLVLKNSIDSCISHTSAVIEIQAVENKQPLLSLGTTALGHGGVIVRQWDDDGLQLLENG